jgi:hypothetical protein
MSRQPRLDVGAALPGQFVVDIGVQFVFGDGHVRFGHRRGLSIEMFSAFFFTLVIGAEG